MDLKSNLDEYRYTDQIHRSTCADLEGANGIFEDEKQSDYYEVDAPYASWSIENEASYSSEEIRMIFVTLGRVFGFQNDNVRNMYDHFMIQLDSRASRMSCTLSLLSLHADYIGGEHSNYKKWYFAAQYDLDENITKQSKRKSYQKLKKNKRNNKLPYTLDELSDRDCLLGMEYKWKAEMNAYSDLDYIIQIALYLLIWGEANNIRFMPECICFIYKSCIDYYDTISKSKEKPLQKEFHFLDKVITPLYNFIRDQQYELVNGVLKKNKKDHTDIVGYDDVNQLFWYPEGLKRIKLHDGRKLFDIPKEERYLHLPLVNWNKLFYKTYKEKRTWMHSLTNFSRVWIIHITMFWYYTCFNSPTLYTKNYHQLLDNKPAAQVQLSAVSFGSVISCLISILATITEWRFVPRKWPGAQHLTGRLLLLILLTLVNIAPSIYIFGFIPLNVYSKSGHIIGVVQFIISVITFLYLAIQPPNKLFSFLLKQSSNAIRTQAFTSAFPQLKFRNKLYSYSLWVCVVLAKFFESYFFLTLSLRDPIRVLSIMEMSRCRGDIIFGTILCKQQARFTLLIIYVTNLVLFFLDTYLWYIVCNCIFSVALSFSLGISIFTPWRNIFSRLPERISSKIIYSNCDLKSNPILLISHIWNSIILSMYREHLLSIDQVNKLVYQQVSSPDYDSSSYIRPPLFFVYQDDSSFSLNDFFTPGKEAERRISFFAQSLSSPIPEPIPTLAMPTFTVLVPHYSEKIILSLKEIIKESKGSKVSLLEYLKYLHPTDWDSFVKDTKILQLSQSADAKDESDFSFPLKSGKEDPIDFIKNQIDDLPYFCVGFKDSSPEYTLRTRIWASLRYQTLYRTISGFMNYETAIKLLYRIENSDVDSKYMYSPEETEKELSHFVKRKFRLLISMQRYQKFDEQEKENANLLFRAYPNLQVAYLEEVNENGTLEYYSTLLDVTRQDEQGNYEKKYRIKLSGNPILGDGKSDNQNHAIIFYRGEYIQVIDANQDNYLEECLKIKSVMAEFEEINLDPSSQYVPGTFLDDNADPVAILGAREYIFSENIGVLGDIAAGKEQTFGTLFARTLAEIGGKLHYGHPDFLNGIFMTTRGGISKAQKGLHLNEDIYAGMTATCRGGRIKHCDFYQCGKGRDLGFGTILNFTTKVGAGMGEQILSREHYYLGTQLPIDRFLSFYYAHPGFHINNLFIMLSVHLFMLVLVNLGSLANESIICHYDHDIPFTDLEKPLGCYNLQPVLNWVTRFVLSVFICFFISFIPLVIQELIEKGFLKALFRVFYHFISMAPFFEVFVCQVYAQSLKDNITFGGAKYISTGRGFATSRLSFTVLYSKYATISIYPGATVFLIILFATLTMWQPSILWFWITFISMCLAPFIFNPHQFSWGRFFLDYREFLRWLSRGNSKYHLNSWIGFTRFQRSRFTGFKKLAIGDVAKKMNETSKRPTRVNAILDQVISPLISTLCFFVPYMFINSQNGVKNPYRVNPLFRLLIIAFTPIVANILILVIIFPISSVLGPLFGFCCSSIPSFFAATAHFLSILIHIITFEVFLFLQGWNFSRTLCGFICVVSLQKTILQFVSIALLSRELKDDYSNRAWWSGKWLTSGLGWLVITQPLREFIVKVCELNQFAYDFILGHVLLMFMSPILFIPFIDKWHTSMLFWLKSSKQFRDPIYSRKQRRTRNVRIFKYSFLFFLMVALMVGLIIIPIVGQSFVPDIRRLLPSFLAELIQPNHQKNNDTGDRAPKYIPRETPRMVPMRTIP
ncbi:uncharacterized protein PRCAT00003227001 [Priceomyces carsonii]|uniref:uncharacterized protein n=1 Tax=Priceomyces carsonii TaxID=28549 RepID=UPI002EDAD67F|nr:unnamed protein product [Priceomyces carsonii]